MADTGNGGGFSGLDASLTWRLVAWIVALVWLGVAAMALYLPPTLGQGAIDTAARASRQMAEQMQIFRGYYSDMVIAKVRASGALTATPFHRADPIAVPSPATLVIESARLTTDRDMRMDLISPFPWPHHENRQMDAFQKEAWAAFQVAPDVMRTALEAVNGQRFLRTAIADKMSGQNCVSCHNEEANSPRRDWKVGDVRAVLDVRRNIEPELRAAETRAWTIVGSFGVLAGLLSAVLVFIARTVDSRTEEKRAADAQVFHMAHHDSLTGLHNRMSITQAIEDAVISQGGRGMGLAVFFIDLDRFKEINDGLGHAAGDLLLKTVAARLLSVVGPNDVVGRLGGDEFIVLQTKSKSIEDTERLAAAVVTALAEPMALGEHEVCISGSVGVFRGTNAHTTRSAMMKSADAAVYKAKGKGKNCFVLFTEHMEEGLAARRTLEQTIRSGLEHDRFELFYQPIVSAKTSQLQGFEALLRLRDDSGAMVSPTDFIPIAEELGLIGQIGSWALMRACETASYWPEHLTVSVNLSPAQFITLTTRDETISQVVRRELARTGLTPHRLELEITEGIFIDKTDFILSELQALKAIGVKIALDDFGTGYSSLAYLWKFPFDKLKIDRSFIIMMGQGDARMTSFVRTIASLGHTLNLKVTAEGIETHEQAAFVRALGVDFIQGFFYGKPVAASQLNSLLLDPSRALGLEVDATAPVAALPDIKPDPFAAAVDQPSPAHDPAEPVFGARGLAARLAKRMSALEKARPAPAKVDQPRAPETTRPAATPEWLPLLDEDVPGLAPLLETLKALAPDEVFKLPSVDDILTGAMPSSGLEEVASPPVLPAPPAPSPEPAVLPAAAPAPNPFAYPANAPVLLGRYAGGIRVTVRPGS